MWVGKLKTLAALIADTIHTLVELVIKAANTLIGLINIFQETIGTDFRESQQCQVHGELLEKSVVGHFKHKIV